MGVVLFADLVAYSRLMAEDNSRALEAVRRLDAAARAQALARGGRLIKSYGDGVLLEFPSARDAVEGGLHLLENGGGDVPVRVGLHLGELTAENGDVYGDVVNIAARVQGLAVSGGLAMTGGVYSQVRNQIPLRARRIPRVRLKNIPERMSIYMVPPRRLSTWQRIVWEGAVASLRWSGFAAPRFVAGAGATALAVVLATARWFEAPAANQAEPNAAIGAKLYRDLHCAYCHSIGGQGGGVGPVLDRVGRDEPDRWLFDHFKDPAKLTPGSKMPKMELYDTEIWHLISFLRTIPSDNARPRRAGGGEGW